MENVKYFIYYIPIYAANIKYYINTLWYCIFNRSNYRCVR